PPSLLLSGTLRHNINNAAAPIGILIKKIYRHNPASASAPPNIGPPTGTTVVTEDHTPMAFPFSFSSMAAEISDNLPGIISAPPTPCTIRHRINTVVSGQTPQAAAPIINTPMPAINILFRPSLSPSEPPIRISDASI